MLIRPSTDAAVDTQYIFEAGNRLLAMYQVIDPFYKPLAAPVIASDIPRERLTFIAEDGGQPVGTITGIFFSAPPDRSYPYAQLQQIWVEESCRKYGAGRELLAAFETVVKVRGGQQISVNVDVRNAQGRDFWIANDYEIYQERRAKKL